MEMAQSLTTRGEVAFVSKHLPYRSVCCGLVHGAAAKVPGGRYMESEQEGIPDRCARLDHGW